jgi:hypothetical protein
LIKLVFIYFNPLPIKFLFELVIAFNSLYTLSNFRALFFYRYIEFSIVLLFAF